MNKNVLFIHGGPGMDSSYLEKWFSPAKDGFDFIYYDQSHDTLDALLEELQNYVRANSRPHIVAHSWGCFLILKALELSYVKLNNLSSIALITPKFLTEERSEKAMAELKESKIPEHEKLKMDKVWEQDDMKKAGREFMEIITPYYHYDVSFDLGVKCDFDRALYYKLSDAIKGYDIRHTLKKLPKEILLLYAESDFIWPEEEYNSYVPSENIHVIEKAGHYVFAEQYDTVMNVLYEFWQGVDQ